MLTGHDHTYERTVVDDFPYFVNGLGGAEAYRFRMIGPDSRVRYNGAHGAMKVTASRETIIFEFYTWSGHFRTATGSTHSRNPESPAPTTSPCSGCEGTGDGLS